MVQNTMEPIPVSGHTGLLCLLGSPVEHSISPAIHNEACRQLGLDYQYLAFNVLPEQMPAAVEGLRAIGARGWNVTMPDKNVMAELCDKLSPASQICGAVNTVINDGGVLTGTTTDGTGWVSCARAAGHDPVRKRLVQLGAGGAGISILVQTALDGAECIDVFNTKDTFWPRVQAVVDRLSAETSCQVSLHELGDLDALKACASKADILLNSTPVGMERVPGCLVPDASYFHPGLAVSDVVYEPQETMLLKMAREVGLDTFNGMYMLLYQGAASFKCWTGREMPVDAIKKKYFSHNS